MRPMLAPARSPPLAWITLGLASLLPAQAHAQSTTALVPGSCEHRCCLASGTDRTPLTLQKDIK